MSYIKFRIDPICGFEIIAKLTPVCARQTDGQTDGRTNTRP